MDLLVLADSDGVVDMTLEAIARRTAVPIEIVRQAIGELCADDPTSRSPEEDGKRLTLVDDHRDWGWQIVNYEHYRALQDNEARRSYFRNRKRAQRALKMSTKCPGHSTPVHNGPHASTPVTDAEGEGEAEYRSKESTSEEKRGTGEKGKEPAAHHKGPTLTDDQFLSELKRHYPGIDIDRELHRMDAWLLTPQGKNRQRTRKFVVNWLNKCDAPMNIGNGHKEGKSGQWLDSNKENWDPKESEAKVQELFRKALGK